MELMKLMEDWNGFVPVSGRHTDAERAAFINLLSNADGVPAHLHEYRIKEALTTSDFPLLFGDVLDRQVLAAYKATAPVWKAYSKQSTVKDFKTAYRYAITGGDGMLDRVAEKGEYLASDREESKYDLSVLKYGRQFDISYEALINDDLGALKDTPDRFARAAIRTEHTIVARLYANLTTNVAHVNGGPLYSTVAGEVNEVAALLTIANLEAGVESMSGVLDAQGMPIMTRAKYLVAPPALEMTARQILTSSSKVWSDNAGGPVAYPTNNVIAQYGLQLIVDPYLPAAATFNATNASANSQWYLFADPGECAALEVAHMSGHERPEICMKASDKVSVGGGAIGPLTGDFATDNVFYRVRLIFGGARLDWRATYMGGSIG